MAFRGLKVAVAATLGLLVAACGGGGGDVGSTPAPPVTTDPPPVTSYQRFGALSGAPLVDTSGYVLAADQSRVLSSRSTATDAVTITYQPDTNSYLVKTPFRGTTSFGPSEVITGPNYAGPAFDYYARSAVVNSASVDNLVAIYKPQGSTISASTVPLTYTTLLRVDQRVTTAAGTFTDDLSWTFGGFATAAADMPRTGTASYAGPAFGQYWNNGTSERHSLQGSLSVTANFGASSLATSVTLNAPNFPLVTFSGNGLIAGNLFNGTLAGAGPGVAPYTGTYDGQFMGPGAAELGLRFSITNNSGAIVGVGAARK